MYTKIINMFDDVFNRYVDSLNRFDVRTFMFILQHNTSNINHTYINLIR